MGGLYTPDCVPIFVYLNMFPLNQPEVLIANAIQKFDEKGILKDAATLERTNELLAALIDWTKKLE
jgi:chromate reductase